MGSGCNSDMELMGPMNLLSWAHGAMIMGSWCLDRGLWEKGLEGGEIKAKAEVSEVCNLKVQRFVIGSFRGLQLEVYRPTETKFTAVCKHILLVYVNIVPTSRTKFTVISKHGLWRYVNIVYKCL